MIKQPTKHLDKIFKLKERNTTITTEIRGGLVTFLAMSYIVVLNPLILGGTNPENASLDIEGTWLPAEQVAATTSLAAGILTILMGLIANMPFALAAGLGINSFIAASIIKDVTWAEAMGLVILNGAVILLLSISGIRTRIFNAIPQELKIAIGVGVGFFLATVGMVNAGFITATENGPPIELGENGSLTTIPVLFFVITFILMATLTLKKVKGAMLISIVACTVAAICVETIWPQGSANENPKGWALTVPQIPSGIIATPDLTLIGEFSFTAFERIGIISATMLILTLVFTNFFDAMGAMGAISSTGGLNNPDGSIPSITKALVVEGIGAAVGGMTSTSSNTVFTESAAGVGEGARTGLASIVTGIMFLLSMFITPLTLAVPLEVASATLVLIGALIISQINHLDLKNLSIAIPSFLTIIVMSLSYSIVIGIGIGFITWTLLKLLSGKYKELNPILIVLTLAFILYFVRGLINIYP